MEDGASSQSAEESSASPEAEEKLIWSVRMWESRPERRLVVFAAAFFAGAIGLAFFKSPILAVFGFLAILGSTTEFWLPIRYVLDQKGASLRCGISVSAIEWVDVKRVLIEERAVKLSPLEGESRMDPFRGIVLRYGEHKEAVVDYIKRHVGDSCLTFGEKS